ncbi:MAG: hypothetical protein ACR2P3_07200, partial [Geminicoccaceae bacterium]
HKPFWGKMVVAHPPKVERIQLDMALPGTAVGASADADVDLFHHLEGKLPCLWPKGNGLQLTQRKRKNWLKTLWSLVIALAIVASIISQQTTCSLLYFVQWNGWRHLADYLLTTVLYPVDWLAAPWIWLVSRASHTRAGMTWGLKRGFNDQENAFAALDLPEALSGTFVRSPADDNERRREFGHCLRACL